MIKGPEKIHVNDGIKLYPADPIQVWVTSSGRAHIFVVNSVVLTCVIENVLMDTCLFSFIKCHFRIIFTVPPMDICII